MTDIPFLPKTPTPKALSSLSRYLLALVIGLCFATFTQAEIYQWVDEKGRIHYSDEKPEDADALKKDVEVKNSNMRFMSDKEKALLEENEKREAAENKENKDNEDEKGLKEQGADSSDKKREKNQSKSDKALGLYCYKESPNFLGQIKPDFITVTELTQKDEHIIERFMDNLDGFWRGNGYEVICKGTFEEPIEDRTDYRIRVDADQDGSDELIFIADLDGADNKGDQRFKYKFFLKDKYFRFNYHSAKGDVELLQYRPKELSFISRFKAGRTTANRLFEEYYSFKIVGKNLHVQVTTFAEGRLVEYRVWEMVGW